MRIVHLAVHLAAIVVTLAVARPHPVLPTVFDTSSPSIRGSGATDRASGQHRASYDPQAASGPSQHRPSGVDLSAPYQDAPLHGVPVTSQPFFTHLPVVRNDVVRSILSDEFGIVSNFPVQQLLGPNERKSLYDLGEQHMSKPEATWLHAVVDEPQFDLTYKKQLYIASPIPQDEWKKAVGLQRTPETENWLPVVFYKASVDRNKRSQFNLAGVEVVRDVDEAMRVLVDMGRRDTLHNIANQLGMVVSHV